MFCRLKRELFILVSWKERTRNEYKTLKNEYETGLNEYKTPDTGDSDLTELETQIISELRRAPNQ